MPCLTAFCSRELIQRTLKIVTIHHHLVIFPRNPIPILYNPEIFFLFYSVDGLFFFSLSFFSCFLKFLFHIVSLFVLHIQHYSIRELRNHSQRDSSQLQWPREVKEIKRKAKTHESNIISSLRQPTANLVRCTKTEVSQLKPFDNMIK